MIMHGKMAVTALVTGTVGVVLAIVGATGDASRSTMTERLRHMQPAITCVGHEDPAVCHGMVIARVRNA